MTAGIQAGEGWVYAAVVLDVFSRRVVRWSIADHLRTELVIDALGMARWRRKPLGTTVHSDRGSQGGFNWSQHLVVMEVLDGTTSAAGGSGASSGDAFTGAADTRQGCGARVLAPDRTGYAQRGCRSRGRRVGAGGDAVVSSRWRHATIEPGRYLSFTEREELALLRARGLGVRAIARELNRNPGTISRELRRNAATRGGKPDYRVSVAQWKAQTAARRPKTAKLVRNSRLKDYVQARLSGQLQRPDGTVAAGPRTTWKGRNKPRREDRCWATAWSPEQIAGPTTHRFPR